MSRKISEILVLFLLGLTIALAPMACGSDSDNGGNDGSRDAVGDMTPG